MNNSGSEKIKFRVVGIRDPTMNEWTHIHHSWQARINELMCIIYDKPERMNSCTAFTTSLKEWADADNPEQALHRGAKQLKKSAGVIRESITPSQMESPCRIPVS